MSPQQALLIALTCIFVIILLGVNIYLLILYSHTDDKGWGTALYCKILIVLGLTLCQAQALMIPLDVANESALLNERNLNMATFWFFLYVIVLIFITLLLPFSLFFYETDQDDSNCKRLLTATCFTFGALVISIMLLFISWNFLKFVTFSYEQITINQSNQQNQQHIQKQIQVSLAVYIIAILSFFGWIFVILFGGVGLFALPIDMINQFRHRPKARKSAQMTEIKNNLVNAINTLMQEGNKLRVSDNQHAKNSEAGWFSRWKQSRNINNQLTQFKAKYYALQSQYEIFNLQLKFIDSNPVIPVLKLILGILFAITSFLWLFQIIFGNIAKSYLGRALLPFLNQLLIFMVDRNAGFIATAIFAYFCLYILWCVQKGTIKFGIRIPCCCRFHPMKENQTWMNSFLFNIILLLIASVGVVQLCVSSFPTYTRNTQIFMIFNNQINFMKFYKEFYSNNVFTIAFVIWSFISLIYMLITCNRKPPYMKQIQKIRTRRIDDD